MRRDVLIMRKMEAEILTELVPATHQLRHYRIGELRHGNIAD
ncbi:MAG: hypothetical protein ACPHJ3_17900 [Rubripirellula sp.]